MHEHTSRAENDPSTPAETDLSAALLLQAAMVLEEHAEAATFTLIRQALAIRQSPGVQELAKLTDALLTHCAILATGVETIPAEKCPPRGAGALRDWAQLRQDGPADGPLGSWSYARQLALIARNMIQAVHAYRTTIAARAPYTSRPNLPSLVPSSQ
ncbi:DUF6415 family natural product biosynthesis protein [Streptomyces sp. NPDC012438]|uniref:DUF6415 family natural product biosynthesis protein n=1 Tax=Streptomyces sp. NPDC012438 TaxID=3364833 RepID=UPI0036F00D40